MSIRRWSASRVRRVMNWQRTPAWVRRPLRRLAHRLHPHVLRCKVCGAEFVAPSERSVMHAVYAYNHYVAVHEPEDPES